MALALPFAFQFALLAYLDSLLTSLVVDRKIEEVQGSSMIQVLDYPEAPAKRLHPRPIRSMILSLFFGISIGIGIIYFKDWLVEIRQNFSMV